MSTADAAGLHELARRGDVAEVTGPDLQMILYNGYGDWKASYADHRAGSALS